MNVSPVTSSPNDTYAVQASRNSTQRASTRQDDAVTLAAQTSAQQGQAVQQQQAQSTQNANRVATELQMQLTATQISLSAQTAQSVAQVGPRSETPQTANAAQAPTPTRNDLESQAELPAQRAAQADRAQEQQAADTRANAREMQNQRDAERLDNSQNRAVNSYQQTQQLLQPPRYNALSKTQA